MFPPYDVLVTWQKTLKTTNCLKEYPRDQKYIIFAFRTKTVSEIKCVEFGN